MIDEFKVGYYYKFVGNINDYRYFNNDQKKLLDGRWHKCIDNYLYHSDYAKFENTLYGVEVL